MAGQHATNHDKVSAACKSLYREIKNPSLFGTVPTTITDTYDSSIIATPYSGAAFTTKGAEFDGVDDYLSITLLNLVVILR